MVHCLETIKRLHKDREEGKEQAPLYWKSPGVPRHVVQMLVLDEEGRTLFQHRSANVRSAPNVWSIPTGMHEIGETIQEAIAREMLEECGLVCSIDSSPLMFMYENIAGDKDATLQYHWVLGVYLFRVRDVRAAINKEPDKHDLVETPLLSEILYSKTWKDSHTFHPSLDAIFVEKIKQYFLGRSETVYVPVYEEQPTEVSQEESKIRAEDDGVVYTLEDSLRGPQS